MSFPSDEVPTTSEVDSYLEHRLDGPSFEKRNRTADEWEAIVETCGYRRTKFYFPLIDISLMGIPMSLKGRLCQPSEESSMGTLDILPHNVFSQVISELDIKSIWVLRNTNRLLHRTITETPQYDLVIRYGLRAMVSLLRMGIHHTVTLGALHLALTSAKCTFCQDYGDLLFLPTASRCCYNCMRLRRETAIVTTRDITLHCPQRHLASLEEALEKDPPMTIIVHDWMEPGFMTTDEKAFLASELIETFSGITGINDDTRLVEIDDWLEYRSGACIVYPSIHLPTATIQRGIHCQGCLREFLGDWPEHERERSDFPDIPEGCQERDRSFTLAGFREHFEACNGAKALWRESEHGAKLVFLSAFVEAGGINLERDHMSVYHRLMRSRLMPPEGDQGTDHIEV